MIYQVLSIRDSKADIFYPPQFKATTNEAKRDFHALVNDPGTMPGKYPADFSLFSIGTYDASSGTLTPETPTKVADGDQMKQ